MQRSRLVALVLIALAAAAAVLVPGIRATPFHGTELGPDAPPRAFTLQSDRGTVSLSDFRGRAVLLFFGYTTCPDACPLTLSKLRQVMAQVGERRAEDTQVIVVTVDPALDTPERLQAYVQRFDPRFLGLGGEAAELEAVAKSFGVWAGEPESVVDPAPAGPGEHEEHEGHAAEAAEAGARLIPHTSHVFGFDREGRLRVLWGPELTAEQIAGDLRGLLRL